MSIRCFVSDLGVLSEDAQPLREWVKGLPRGPEADKQCRKFTVHAVSGNPGTLIVAIGEVIERLSGSRESYRHLNIIEALQRKDLKLNLVTQGGGKLYGRLAPGGVSEVTFTDYSSDFGVFTPMLLLRGEELRKVLGLQVHFRWEQTFFHRL